MSKEHTGIFGQTAAPSRTKLLSAVICTVFAAGISGIVLSACAVAEQSGGTAPETISVEAPALPGANSFSANYLSSRFAQRRQDWHAAQAYMNAASAHDDRNTVMLQKTFLLSLGAGEYARARELALQLADDEAMKSAAADTPYSAGFDVAFVYLAAEALANDDMASAQKYLDALPDDGFGQYTKPLLSAWTKAGDGKTEEAIALLRAVSGEEDPTFNIHAALIHEMQGDDATAEKHFRLAMPQGLTMHTAVLSAQFFARTGKDDVARGIYDSLGQVYSFNPFLFGKTMPGHGKRNVTRAADGAAAALFDLAAMLYERRAYDSAQIYARIVARLAPESPFARLMSGDIAAILGRDAEARENFAAIPQDSPLYWMAQLRIAETLDTAGAHDAAEKLLRAMAQDPDMRVQALIQLGDNFRKREAYSSALAAYDEAIDAGGGVKPELWPVIYARGVTLERLDQWARAEKDLLQALEYEPDNAMILNYLGYSWADQGINLDKALDYTRRAVALKPDDGYVIDSYAWTLFRLGRTDEAVAWLEKAVALVPEDSTILDHLADAYWKSGRHAEARFKWRRAQQISHDAGFQTKVEQKIVHGLNLPPAKAVPTAAPAADTPTPAATAQKEASLF